MFRIFKFTILATLAGVFAAQGAFAFLAPNPIGPISLQHGFPIWVEDDLGLRSGPNLPLSTPDGPILGNDFTQLTGFGAEAFWWGISGTNGSIDIEFAMEAAFFPSVANGNQEAFSRIRIRGTVNAEGTWNVSNGVGVNFDVTADAAGDIDHTDDIPFGIPGEIPPFSSGLANSPLTTFYLLPPTAVPAPQVSITPVSVIGVGTPQVVDLTALDFGVVFPNDPLNNQPPVANPDTAAVAAGASKVIFVLDNDADAPAVDNDFLINTKAIGLVYPVGFTPQVAYAATPFEIGVATVATAQGGTVKKNSDGTVTYTAPPAGYTGPDSFQYVVQDDAGCISGTIVPCGLVSAAADVVPTTVSVTVQDVTITEAEFMPKFMKWSIKGAVAGGANSTVDIYAGDDVTNHPIIASGVPTDANGIFTFNGKSLATPGDLAQVTVETPQLINKVGPLSYK